MYRYQDRECPGEEEYWREACQFIDRQKRESQPYAGPRSLSKSRRLTEDDHWHMANEWANRQAGNRGARAILSKLKPWTRGNATHTSSRRHTNNNDSSRSSSRLDRTHSWRSQSIPRSSSAQRTSSADRSSSAHRRQ